VCTVIPLRPRAAGGYTDTEALNDIHTLLTATSPDDATLADVAQILVRTGRPLVAIRDIEITMTETALGWPMACARSEDTTVFIRQAPASSGLLIEICSRTDTEHDGLTVTLDGHPLHPAPPGGHAA
jgi:hypothetical protein